jgi:hypothetical protein
MACCNRADNAFIMLHTAWHNSFNDTKKFY